MTADNAVRLRRPEADGVKNPLTELVRSGESILFSSSLGRPPGQALVCALS